MPMLTDLYSFFYTFSKI